MKNKKQLFELYKEWMELGTMGKPMGISGGLCNELPKKYINKLELFVPEIYFAVFWAYNGKPFDKRIEYRKYAYDFTKLRQMIVLLICAMENEI